MIKANSVFKTLLFVLICVNIRRVCSNKYTEYGEEKNVIHVLNKLIDPFDLRRKIIDEENHRNDEESRNLIDFSFFSLADDTIDGLEKVENLIEIFFNKIYPFIVDKIRSLNLDLKDPSLPKKIIETFSSKEERNETACVQLLICKISPLIWGLQTTAEEDKHTHLGKKLPEFGTLRLIIQSLYNHLPDFEDFLEFSNRCHQDFPACDVSSDVFLKS